MLRSAFAHFHTQLCQWIIHSIMLLLLTIPTTLNKQAEWAPESCALRQLVRSVHLHEAPCICIINILNINKHTETLVFANSFLYIVASDQ
uniref:Secreted protein n=1 Tax=Rhipicephalus appendiculatus TaxID=34631 RepID=A0A131YEU1_RHIAP